MTKTGSNNNKLTDCSETSTATNPKYVVRLASGLKDNEDVFFKPVEVASELEEGYDGIKDMYVDLTPEQRRSLQIALDGEGDSIVDEDGDGDHHNGSNRSLLSREAKYQNCCGLFREAWHDIKRHGSKAMFSPYDGNYALDYGHEIVALATVFLAIKLGYRKVMNFTNDPEPLLIAGLCFFHIMVYWINWLHYVKYQDLKNWSLHQFWLLAAFCLGITYYPVALEAWLDGDERTINERAMYYVVNIYLICCMALFAWTSKYQQGRYNNLYWLHNRLGILIVLIYYIVALILDQMDNIHASRMVFVAPFLCAAPFGGDRRPEQQKQEQKQQNCSSTSSEEEEIEERQRKNNNNHNKDSSSATSSSKWQSIKSFLYEAWLDAKSPQHRFCPFEGPRLVNFFNSVTSLACTFLVFQFSWQQAYDSDRSTMWLSIFSYFHVMVIWINLRHFLKYSPEDFSLLQVWCCAGMVLFLTYYPLSLELWIEEGHTTLYFIVCISICSFMCVLNYTVPVDTSQANALYIVYHSFFWPIAMSWFVLACLLTELGFEGAAWMVYVSPFLAAVPLGGQRER